MIELPNKYDLNIDVKSNNFKRSLTNYQSKLMSLKPVIIPGSK